MRLMERAGLPFAVFGYSSSVYGQTDAQFALLDRLASKCNARRTHHQIVRTLLSLACALVSVRDRHTAGAVQRTAQLRSDASHLLFRAGN